MLPFGNGHALRLASSERSCHESDHMRSALDGWLALGQPVKRWQNTLQICQTQKQWHNCNQHPASSWGQEPSCWDHGSIVMHKKCERTSWVQHAVNNFVCWLVVKTSCPSCPISDRLPTVIVEDKVRVPAFLKRFKEEEFTWGIT